MRKFRRGDISAIVLAVVLGTFWLYTYFNRPDWSPPSGFGPEWRCTDRGVRGGGPDFCIKKPLANSALQTTTPD